MTQKTKKTLMRDKVDQKRANALKTIRAAIRLKYSIMADEELNVRLPAFESEFNRRANEGELLDPLSLMKALDVN